MNQFADVTEDVLHCIGVFPLRTAAELTTLTMWSIEDVERALADLLAQHRIHAETITTYSSDPLYCIAHE